MAKFNEYPTEATPTDDDTLLMFENTSKKNRQIPFSGVWNWIVKKLTDAVISNLQTENKTVIGALNELNSKAPKGSVNIIGFRDIKSIYLKVSDKAVRYGVITMFYLSNYVGSTFNVITVSGDTIKQSNPDSYVTINPNQEDLDINIVFKTKYTHGCVLVSGSLSNADVTTFNQ